MFKSSEFLKVILIQIIFMTRVDTNPRINTNIYYFKLFLHSVCIISREMSCVNIISLTQLVMNLYFRSRKYAIPARIETAEANRMPLNFQ